MQHCTVPCHALQVRAFLAPPLKGCVLQTYGVGNAPSNRPDILSAFQDATNRGVIVVNCTQCMQGSVVDSYVVGRVSVCGAEMCFQLCFRLRDGCMSICMQPLCLLLRLPIVSVRCMSFPSEMYFRSRPIEYCVVFTDQVRCSRIIHLLLHPND